MPIYLPAFQIHSTQGQGEMGVRYAGTGIVKRVIVLKETLKLIGKRGHGPLPLTSDLVPVVVTLPGEGTELG